MEQSVDSLTQGIADGIVREQNPSVSSDKPKRKRSSVKIVGESDEVPSEETGAVQDYEAIGKVVTQSFFSLCLMFGGQEWKPNADEDAAITVAWTEYFKSKGISAIPPELMLVLSLGAYSGRRFVMPNTSSRLRRWYMRLRGHEVQEQPKSYGEARA